jgi:hypothetical protein
VEILDIFITTGFLPAPTLEVVEQGLPAKVLMEAAVKIMPMPEAVAALERLAEQTELALVETD